MHYVNLLAGLMALASPVFSHSYVRCADPQPDEEFRQATADMALHAASVESAAAGINVRTFAHVVTTKARKGDFPLAQVKKQIQVMNNRYKSANIKFTLAGTDFTVNNAWAAAEPQSQTEINMKNALHKGTYADLNLYLLSSLGNGLLGYCPFPYTNIYGGNPNSTQYIKYDGCLILADSMPGGSAAPYDKGLTAVHEVGHWYGLYHVFQGNKCSGTGDFVADTPLQRTATAGCPKNKNTCPQKGADSIHNYMDYSDDVCLTTFSPDQRARARAIYNAYRKCNGACQ